MIDYWDYEEVIKKFWECNIKQDYKEFDFIEAFEAMEGLFYNKLSMHGLLDFEDFKESMEELYKFDNLSEHEQVTDYIQITQEDLKNALLKYKYERNRNEFLEYSSFKTLREIYDNIQKAKNGEMERLDMVVLFDSVIHAEHETGNIFDNDFNIQTLREDFERGLSKNGE